MKNKDSYDLQEEECKRVVDIMIPMRFSKNKNDEKLELIIIKEREKNNKQLSINFDIKDLL